MELRAEFGALYDDQLFADLYSPQRSRSTSNIKTGLPAPRSVRFE